MKKLLLFLIPLILFASCGNITNKNSALGEVLQGDHLVTKLRLSIDSTQGQQTNFFIIKEKGTILTFSWQLPDSTTVISNISMTKVRMKFDPNAYQPSIKFRWRAGGDVGQNWDEIFNDYVTYIVINCKEEDFPSNTKIN